MRGNSVKKRRKLRFANPKRETQGHLPFTLEDCGGMDAVYVDQGPQNVQYGYRSISSFYTPYGIGMRDHLYSQRIMAADGHEDERAELKREIVHDPHLHFVIKENLLYNLKIRAGLDENPARSHLLEIIEKRL